MRLRGNVPFYRLVALALRATLELALARLVLHRTKPADVLRRNALSTRAAAAAGSAMPDEAAARRCDEVASVISAMALRVPWRADCLVQALAGQRWLLKDRIESKIVIGTAKKQDGAFEAHAWLLQGANVILGGDITRFETLLDPELTRIRTH